MGQCPMRNLEAFSGTIGRGLETRALARQCQYCLSFIAPRTVRHETRIITVGHRPPCVYHLSTRCNCTWSNLPGLLPLYLHTVSDQILEVGMAWERGYNITSFWAPCPTFHHLQYRKSILSTTENSLGTRVRTIPIASFPVSHTAKWWQGAWCILSCVWCQG